MSGVQSKEKKNFITKEKSYYTRGANNYPDYEEFNNTIFDREITWEKLESWFSYIPPHAFDELIANALLLSAYSNFLDVELPINRPCNYKNERLSSKGYKNAFSSTRRK